MSLSCSGFFFDSVLFCDLVLSRIIVRGLALFLANRHYFLILSCKTQSTLENIR